MWHTRPFTSQPRPAELATGTLSSHHGALLRGSPKDVPMLVPGPADIISSHGRGHLQMGLNQGP